MRVGGLTVMGDLAYDPKYTSLLLHMDGADNGVVFMDSAIRPKAVTAGGHACTKIGVKKFGSASGYFDGNSDDYLKVDANVSDFNFGSGDFSIDAWIYNTGFSPSANYVCAWGTTTPTNRSWGFGITSASLVLYYSTNGSSDASVSQATGFSLNTWYHIAICRSGNLIYLFKDGVLLNAGGTAFADTIYNSNTSLWVGNFMNWPSNHAFKGYIDELRISKGIARWTADFSGSLPAAEYLAD